MKRIHIAMLAVAAVTLAACNDDDPQRVLTPAYFPSQVSMVVPEGFDELVYTDSDDTQVLPLLTGQSLHIDNVVEPDSVTFKDVVWYSSNTSVVSVDTDGNIEALQPGYSVLQVSPDAGYGTVAASTMKVIVVDQLELATAIDITGDATQIYATESTQLSATVLPSTATYRTVKWKSSNESVATVDKTGKVTALDISALTEDVTITATALDGSGATASYDITVVKSVAPEEVTIDSCWDMNHYQGAYNEKYVTLTVTTVPASSTQSLLEWSSSDESIATVQNGVVTWNNSGVFGTVDITATCPSTGNSSTITMELAAGLIRELYHNKSVISWNIQDLNSDWSYGCLTCHTYYQNETKQRGDFKSQGTAYVHAGNYPIMAFKMDDVKYLYDDVTTRAFKFDSSGTCNGTKYSGEVGNGTDKYLHLYRCGDGSYVFIYDFSQQEFPTGGLLPTGAVATFSTFQIKYADIATATESLDYRVFWVQTFRSIEELQTYLNEVDMVTYEVVK